MDSKYMTEKLMFTRTLCKALGERGYPTFIVGGFVRDYYILKRPVLGGMELATKASTSDLVEVLSETPFKVHVIANNGAVLEIGKHCWTISTFRTSWKTKESDSSLLPATIHTDLSQRDFTVNAVAYDIVNKAFVDPYYGRTDGAMNLLTAIGTASCRFKEDYIRMFRACRLVATHSFSALSLKQSITHTLEQEDLLADANLADIASEIDKCFKWADKPSLMLNMMLDTGLLKAVLPELEACVDFEQNEHHNHDLYTHIVLAVDHVKKTTPLVRWAALFHDLGKISTLTIKDGKRTFVGHEKKSAEIAEEIMTRLGFSDYKKKLISLLVYNHMYSIKDDMNDKTIRKFIAKIGIENIVPFFRLKQADKLANGNYTVEQIKVWMSSSIKRIKESCKAIDASKPFCVASLEVDGHDVIDILGIPAGEQVGAILKELFEDVLEEPTRNERAYLTQKVIEIGSRSNLNKCGVCFWFDTISGCTATDLPYIKADSKACTDFAFYAGQA